MTVFNSFADLAQARINLADAREGITESYDGAFLEHSDLAKLNIMAQSPGRSENGQCLEQAVNTAGPCRVFGCCDAVDPADDWARATRIVSLLNVAFPSNLATGLCSVTVPVAVAARRHRRSEDSPSPHPRFPSPHSSPGRRSAKISIT